MNVRSLGTAVALLAAVAACSSSAKRSGFGEDESSTDPNATGNQNGFGDTSNSGNTAANCSKNSSGDPDTDYDGDGYPLKNDCNECDPNTNPGAYDVPGNGLDENCSGTPDDEEVDCDNGLPLDPTNAMDAAKAMGLCKVADTTKNTWGVIEAKWVKPDGTSIGNLQTGAGVLTKFGKNAPQAGASFLVLSSGTARGPSDPGYQDPSGDDKGYTSKAPAGYPKESPACPGVKTGAPHDGIALEVKLKVPSNAKSFSYQQNFFTYEYPTFICSTYNDFFVTMMDPKPANLPDGNIAFDQDGNPISVNNSLLQACAPGSHGGRNFSCPLGTSILSNTGFDQSAATGWLTTQAPVDPDSTITLRFAIWDSGDGVLDSTVLLDDFKFSAEPANGTVTVPTGPN